MNKLIFTFKQQFNEDIILISNNHKDLEDYLKSKYNWHYIEVKNESVVIQKRYCSETEVASIKWVKHT